MAKKEKHKREATQLEDDSEQQSAASHKASERINWGRGEHITAYSRGKNDDMESMQALTRDTATKENSLVYMGQSLRI